MIIFIPRLLMEPISNTNGNRMQKKTHGNMHSVWVNSKETIRGEACMPQPGFEPGTARSSVWRSPSLSY